KVEIENLVNLHKSLSARTKLDKMKFREFLYSHFNLTDDLIMDRIFKAFDKNNEGYVAVDSWLRGLSIFIRGSTDEHISFCFDLYDLNNDGYISKDEVYTLLKKSVVRQISDEDPEDATKELVDLVIKKLVGWLV
ncbi:hypothetical protein HELRODRAFT_79024, partial [Helobdella robusta]|uniref:EF-hand domain-containing protein n=1 Tax=Helobdella robusta TaxID=6412 RepID=T1G3I7_HELRO